MKILYVTTISNTVNAFLIPHIKMLTNMGHKVDVAFNIEQDVKKEIYDMRCKVHKINFKRSPLKNNYYKLIKNVKEIVVAENYNIVHTHTPIASAIVRLACKNIDNVKVIYTAHGFHFYEGAPLINWITFYPIEKILSRYTNTLITINEEDYERSQKFNAKQTEFVPGVGIDVKKFESIDINVDKKRKEINLPENSFIITSVGELNDNKNHQIIIKALGKLNNIKIHYVICGNGSNKQNLIELSKLLGLEKNIHLIGYRKDIPEILAISDAFAFPSKREGLGLSAIEAMASGLPIITSKVHGILDYSKDGETGFTFSPNNVDEAIDAIEKTYNLTDLEIKKISKNNQEKAMEYDLSVITKQMKLLYESMIMK